MTADDGPSRLPAVPLGIVAAEDEPLRPATINRAVWAFVFLGLAARAIRYALCFPIWQDEAYLAVNYLDRGYLDLTGTLECHQVCPLLFLWTQYTLTKLLGFSVASLRLLPFLCGVGSLFVFRHLAARLLRGTALLFAVGIFAVAYPLIRYSCEAKPYGCDVFFSLAMLALAVDWWTTGKSRGLWCLAALTPIALGFSFPAVFTAAGISLSIALALLSVRDDKSIQADMTVAVAGNPTGNSALPQSRLGQGRHDDHKKVWAAWCVFNAALLGGFGLFYSLSVRNQTAGELAWMQDCWRAVFPTLDSLTGFFRWLAIVHTSELLQYPVGGARGASILTAICCAAAMVVLWRRRQFVLAVFCLAPFLPNFAAACMHRYPYGGHVRFGLYLAPMICLLAGFGAAILLVYRKSNGVTLGRTACMVLAALLATVACVSIARDCFFPYRTTSVLRHRDFARRFWQDIDAAPRTFCWETDVEAGRRSPVPHAPVAALYRCNRAIYSQQRSEIEPIHLQDRTAVEPTAKKADFRCVRFSSFNPERTKNLCGSTTDELAFAAWLESIGEDYELVDETRHELPISNRQHGRRERPLCIDTVTVYQFTPKPLLKASVNRGTTAGF